MPSLTKRMDNYDTAEEEVVVEETQPEVVVEEVEAEEEPVEEEVDWKARALKAEQAIIKAKAKPVKSEPKVDSKLTTFDMLALQKANIETEEDLDEVTRWADYNKITVADALKSTILKTVLSEKAEQRKSAMAVNTGIGRRASGGTISDERLLADARKGILPDGDDISRLAVLRLKNK